jgi:hypothetical protein
LREEYRLRLFGNRVMRKLFETERDEVTGEWKRPNSEDLIICAPHEMFLRRSNEEECDGRGMWHVWGRREVHIGLWWET